MSGSTHKVDSTSGSRGDPAIGFCISSEAVRGVLRLYIYQLAELLAAIPFRVLERLSGPLRAIEGRC